MEIINYTRVGIEATALSYSRFKVIFQSAVPQFGSILFLVALLNLKYCMGLAKPNYLVAE